MKNKSKLFNIIVFTLFIIIILIMSFHHENWRDEAQAYLLCRDMNLFELFRNVHYEGHPILYYLFLYPLVKLGIGIKSVNILSFIFMSISVFLILFKSKLNNFQKLGIIISYPVLYEFSIVGRSYSLIFLLLTISGLLYPVKDKYPIYFSILLGLLLNTHLLMVGFVGINVLLFYVYEIFKNKKNTNKRIIIGFFIILLFSLLLFIQFYPILFSYDGMSLSKDSNFLSFIVLFFSVLYAASWLQDLIAVLLSIIVLTLLYFHIFNTNKKSFLILIIIYLFIVFLMNYIFNGINIYSLALSASILYVIILILKNIDKDRKITVLLILLSLLSLPFIVRVYYLDYNYNYSSAYETSNYINKNISKDSIFICNYDALCSSIIPYVDNRFYSTKTNSYFTYVVWDKNRESSINFDKLYKYIEDHNSLYYIVSDYNKDEDINMISILKKKYKLDKIYKSSKTISGYLENYTIYKIYK